jgi:high-affinity Fe2+/Pb2+ permease
MLFLGLLCAFVLGAAIGWLLGVSAEREGESAQGRRW